MKIKWVKRRIERLKNSFIYLASDGKPYQWKKLGDVVEVPDEQGFELLKRDGDILERVEETPEVEVKEESKPKVAKKKTKRQSVVRNKVMKDYEDK